MRTTFIDADCLVYWATFGSQQNFDEVGNPEGWALTDPDHARELVRRDVNLTKKFTEADRVVLALSDHPGRYFRRNFWPGYKASRTARKPELFDEIRGLLLDQYDAIVMPGCEGDDVLGILATAPDLEGEAVIASIDKDLMQIPVLRFDPWKDAAGGIRQPLEDPDRFHMLQTLTGDAVDDYPGLPGIGPVRAEKILGTDAAPLPVLWARVRVAYDAQGLSEQDALAQARCAKILTHDLYNHGRQEPIVWTPPE